MLADPGSEPDEALIAACLAGAPGAMERLVAKHAALIGAAVRTVLTRAGAAGDADLEDEARVRVHALLCEKDMRVLRSFGGRSKLGTFLAVIARRVTLKLLEERRPIVERRRREPAESAVDVPGREANPLERAADEEEQAIVRAAVAALPARDAVALRLFYESGLGHKEIAAVLRVPITSVGQILARAREKLRIPLDRAGLGQNPENDRINSGPRTTNPVGEGAEWPT